MNEETSEARAERLAKLIEHVPGALFEHQWWPDGRTSLAFASDGFTAIFGLDPEELRDDATALFAGVVPEDQERIRQAFLVSAQQLAPWHEEFRYRRPDGDLRVLDVQGTPERQPDGSFVWFGYVQDVSERARMEEELRRDRQRLRAVLASTDAGIWEWNPQTDEAYFDAGWARIVGREANEREPMTMAILRELAHEGDRVDAERRLREYVASPGEASFKANLRVRHRDGHWVRVELRGRIVSRTLDGRPDLVVGVALDHTELLAIEEQLRQASEYARSLIEASVDPLVTIGVDGRIMDVNEATESATGRSRAELIGSDFSDYFTEPDKARAGYQQVFTMGRVVDYPLTLQHASGRTVDVLYNASTYHDEKGRVAGVFAAARDVTEARRTQRELEDTNREVLLLSQMSDLLQSCQSVRESVPILQASLAELFPKSVGRGFVMNAASNQLDQVIAWGGMESEAITVNPGDCWALRRSMIHEVNLGNPLNPPCHMMADERRPYVCVPLLAQGQALGIIHLVAADMQRSRDRFSHLARAVADSVSLALANIRLRENLQSLSTKDPLTGLYNRRFLEEALSRELCRAGRNRNTGVVAMIDIDHFKDFNDTYGHDAGDAVLVAVAGQLKGFRGTDLPCRYGGEEFLLVLTDLTEEQAHQRLEALREAISQTTAFQSGKVLPAITVSIGMATFPHHGFDGAALIKSADEALYRAKARGRNRVEVAGVDQ